MQPNYVIGLDFGTDSVRALVVNAATGEELSCGIHYYSRWKERKYCDPGRSQYRQHPLDYIESMEQSILFALGGVSPQIIAHIKGIGVDTTGSTPAPVDKNGTPLALLPDFEQESDAMFILWKDHTAQAEAAGINALAHQWETDYTAYSGTLYSPEWFWSKILHITRRNQRVADHAFSWAEHCDWIPALLTGNTDPLTWTRSRCAAGHKAMWQEAFGGLPSAAFLSRLHPAFPLLRERLYSNTQEADTPAGTISPEWARKLGLPPDVVVATGAIDAHAGAAGAHIDAYTMVKVMGTSTCDMVVVPQDRHSAQLVKGICGQVNGSILPGMLGLEAGQSAFGDVYNWFVQLLMYPFEVAAELLPNGQETTIQRRLFDSLNTRASLLPVTGTDPVALDWINGRRTPDVDLSLKGAITGLQLGTGAPGIYRALVEATAFGAKAIVDRFESEGIPIHRILATGGISKKSSYVMQVLCNVLNRPIGVVRSEQTCALGSAIFAATAAGMYTTVTEAQQHMASPVEKEYRPDAQVIPVYAGLYERYRQLAKTCL